MEAQPPRRPLVVPPNWAPQLQQAIDDAARRDAEMLTHLQSQLDGPTAADIVQGEDW
jgi:hypothetical protein